jgi:hypothetical protein
VPIIRGVRLTGSEREEEQFQEEGFEKEQFEEELTKLVFELCKHLTTLCTAAVLVVLAVYRDLAVERTFLHLPLFIFGLTILGSILTAFGAVLSLPK